MGVTPLISICIPAYQRTEYLRRLLDSIEMQTFRRFEVIITDDSPGTELQNLVENHPLQSMIRYYKNQRTLGTPENWNALQIHQGQKKNSMHCPVLIRCIIVNGLNLQKPLRRGQKELVLLSWQWKKI